MRSTLRHILGFALMFLVAAAMPLARAEAQAAAAERQVVIGIAAPLTGSVSLLGQQVRDGARAAISARRDGKSPPRIVEADTSCTADGGKSAAQRFVESGANIVVGFLCTDAIETALPILKKAKIPLLDVGVRADRLTDKRERTGNLVWRIAPRADKEAGSIAKVIADRWQSEPFGLIDDGSIAARGLADTVRRLLGDQGLQPQTVDNYRPAEEKQFGLVRRLQRTGVTRFFIAGDRPDVAIVLRDAAASGLDLNVIGGEQLIDEAGDVALPEGVVAVAQATRFPDLAQGASSNPAKTPIEEDAMGPQGYFGPAYAAAQIALSALDAAAGSGAAVVDALNRRTFATAFGPVRFDAKGDSDLDLTRILRWDGERFVPEAGG